MEDNTALEQGEIITLWEDILDLFNYNVIGQNIYWPPTDPEQNIFLDKGNVKLNSNFH